MQQKEINDIFYLDDRSSLGGEEKPEDKKNDEKSI